LAYLDPFHQAEHRAPSQTEERRPLLFRLRFCVQRHDAEP